MEVEKQDELDNPIAVSGTWKRNIALFMGGQAISLFGSSLVEFAIIWHITLATKSASVMMISILCNFIPRLLISLFSGVWADRYSRRLLIILADGGIAFVTLLLAVAFLFGYQHLWLIFLILAIRSVGTGIQTPAVNALIPQIVPAGYLLRINGINGSLQSFILLLAPAASGALLTVLPLGYIFFIDIFTAIISILILSLLKIGHHLPPEDRVAKHTGYLKDIYKGLAFAKENIFVKEMLLIYAFHYFFIAPAAFLSPLFVARVFGEEVWRLSVNEIVFSIGMMLGGLFIARWKYSGSKINVIAYACMVVGLTNLFLGLFSFPVFLVLTFIMGIAISISSSTEMALFQEKVALHMQGRVFSLIQIVTTSVMPLAMLLFGPLGDIVNVEWLFAICGFLLILLGGYIYMNKRLRNAVEGESSG